tara:strand:- start:225 stop:329 length:105 start_codon:yes stop_codon:yes gene_type:complete
MGRNLVLIDTKAVGSRIYFLNAAGDGAFPVLWIS